MGCGVAYALMRAGMKDILVLECADDLGQMTTAQGAGLCGQVRDSMERVKLAMHSVKIFRELQQDTASPLDWNECGSVRLALNERRAGEFRQLERMAKEAGLEAALVDRQEASGLWPLMDFSEVKAVLWCPSDGCLTPHSLVRAYVAQCRQGGVRFATGVRVDSLRVENGRVQGVQTNRGEAKSRWVINAAGAHAYHVAKLAGLDLPIVPVRHEYFVSVPMPGLNPKLPCFRIPELTLYGRVREGGLLVGGWEPNSLHVNPSEYRMTENPPAIQPDERILGSFEECFARLMPSIRGMERQRIGKGWPTFTPDGRLIIGESSRARGFVMAGGCNAHGISGSGGIGKLLVESLLDPDPSSYVRSLSPDRFTETEWKWDEAQRQAARVYETYYGTDIC